MHVVQANLAALLHDMGTRDEALPLYERALKGAEETLEAVLLKAADEALAAAAALILPSVRGRAGVVAVAIVVALPLHALYPPSAAATTPTPTTEDPCAGQGTCTFTWNAGIFMYEETEEACDEGYHCPAPPLTYEGDEWTDCCNPLP